MTTLKECYETIESRITKPHPPWPVPAAVMAGRAAIARSSVDSLPSLPGSEEMAASAAPVISPLAATLEAKRASPEEFKAEAIKTSKPPSKPPSKSPSKPPHAKISPAQRAGTSQLLGPANMDANPRVASVPSDRPAKRAKQDTATEPLFPASVDPLLVSTAVNSRSA